ncbi:MAG: hypothetical protein OXH03_04705 [Bacteroidetes bacterium]|nr:hypothetical protein [Bacteroidota bacterium]MDE2672732.1 hypothetical protein [Bacteroidota bacterium]
MAGCILRLYAVIYASYAYVNQNILYVEPFAGKHHSQNSIIEADLEFRSGTATVLDRVHAAMILQTSGHANALRTLVDSELSRGPEFLHLANALSALYPSGSQEKRIIDAMLLAVPR